MSANQRVLSDRLAALINLSKRVANGTSDATLESISEALEWCYCANMRLADALHHALEALKEANAEPRLCLGAADIEALILAPIKGLNSIELFGPSDLQVKYSVESFYMAMINHVLGKLMCTRVDWCAEELRAETRTAEAFLAQRRASAVVDA